MTTAPTPAPPAQSGASSWRRIAWVAVVVAAVALLAVAAFDQGGAETDAERITRLGDSFACPQCQGESVSESNAAVAAEIRDFIAAEVSRGATDTEIRDQLVAAYGVRVLLTPPADGLAALVWVLPVVVATGGAAVVAAVFARPRPERSEVSNADRELVEAARRARRSDP